MSKSKLFTKDFLVVALMNFVSYLVYYLLMIIIADFAMSHLGATPSQAGGAVGLFIVGALVARIATGSIVERVGHRRMLYIGLAIYLIATFFYYHVGNLPLLFVIRFIHGVGFGITSVVTGTVVAQLIPSARRGEGIGYYSLSTTLASAIGPLLGMFLNSHVSFNAIITVSAILLAVSGIAGMFLKIPASTPETPAELAEEKKFALRNLFEKGALPISFVGALLGVGYASVITFLSSYTKDIDLVAAGSFFFIVYSVAVLLTRPVAGRWLDTKGANTVMYPAFIAFVIGLFLLGAANNTFFLLLSAVFVGAGFGTFLSSGQTIAIASAPEHRIGLATSTFLAIVDAGVGIGPSILGALVPMIGYRGIYFAMAVLIVVALALYFVFNSAMLNKQEETSEDSFEETL